MVSLNIVVTSISFCKTKHAGQKGEKVPNHCIDFVMLFLIVALQHNDITPIGPIITEVQFQLMEMKLNLPSVIKK